MRRSSITWSSIWNLILTLFDDIIAGAAHASEDEAFDLYTQAKEILQRGGFNLRKFLTNSQHLQLRIDQAEKSRNQPKKIVREECPHYLDETYAEATLGSNPEQEAGEQRYLEYARSQAVISSYLT